MKIAPFRFNCECVWWGVGGSMDMKGEKKESEWCGQECRLLHVLSQHMFIRASWLRDHFTLPSIYTGKTKKRKQRGSSKRLHARRARPLATVSHHDLHHSWLSSIHPLVIKGCMRRGTHMGICYFFLHRRHALARPVFSPLRPTSVVCLLVKGPSVQLCCRAPLEWDFFFCVCVFFSTFKLRPHGVGDANSLLSVNFTSLAFVGPVYNGGEMWNKPSTRRRKLEPGLTICGIIKTVFVPPWLTLFASLFCSLLSFPPNFHLPCHRSVFHKPSLSFNALL